MNAIVVQGSRHDRPTKIEIWNPKTKMVHTLKNTEALSKGQGKPGNPEYSDVFARAEATGDTALFTQPGRPAPALAGGAEKVSKRGTTVGDLPAPSKPGPWGISGLQNDKKGIMAHPG